MVGRTDISRCCCCEVADTDDAATECSGSWSGTTIRTPAGADSLLLYDITTLAGSAWYSSVLVQWDPAASGSPDAWCRVVGGATDCDNYFFFEYLPAYQPFGQNGQLQLGKVVAGVETILAKHQHTRAAYSGSFAGSQTLNLCWDGTTLTGWIGSGVPSFVLASRDVSISDARAGFGVTTYVSMDAVNFSTFALERANVGACQTCPEHCCMGPVPTSVTLEISNVDSQVVTISGGCQTDCNQLNGTFVLPIIGVNDSAAQAGDATCRWGLDIPVDAAPCGGKSFKIRAAASISGGVVTIIVTVVENFNNVAALIGTTTLPCTEWTSYIDLSNSDGYGLCSMAGTSTVFRIKKT